MSAISVTLFLLFGLCPQNDGLDAGVGVGAVAGVVGNGRRRVPACRCRSVMHCIFFLCLFQGETK